MSLIKIGGVVVLYNPPSVRELKENIKSYIDEVDVLFLVDNSERIMDANAICSYSEKIEYYSMQGNIGLAKALNYGCMKAVERQCDYILLLDQDSFFKEDSFRIMTEKIRRNNHIALYAPNICAILRKDGKRLLSEEPQFPVSEEKITFAITSGSVIKADIYKRIGFDTKLFIAQIDQDYCCSLNKIGEQMLRLGEVILYQEFGKPYIKNIFGKKVVIHENSPMRYYYVARNEIYLRNKWGELYRGYRISFVKYVIVVMLQRQKMKKLYMMLKGIYDGFRMRVNRKKR